MTKDEALLYLPIADLSELEDVYDERMHEFRSFFLNKVPINKLYRSKFETLRKVHQAYEVLGEEQIEAKFESYEMLPYDASNVFDLVIAFQTNTSNLRQAIVLCESVLELIYVGEQLLDNMRAYASHWQMDFDKSLPDVKVSQPMSEVDLLIELERLNKLGDARMDKIGDLDRENIVYKEAIRLSLWRKMDEDV